jgi:enoyl reductase
MCRWMLRRGLPLAAAALVAASLLAGPAWADGVPGQSSDQGVSHSGNTYAPRVVVTVTTNGVRTTTAASAPASSYVHPPCWMEPSFTGPDLYQWYASGDAARIAHHTGDTTPTPPPDYAEHQNDGPDVGMYWTPMCSSEYWDGDLASFFAYVDQFFAAHPADQWVPVTEGDPNDDIVIPPQVLMHIALNLLDLSQGPGVEINPAGNSVVNLPTWVWATDATFVEHRVRAQFNGNWAEVIATPVRLVVSTNGPADLNGDCAGGGTVYHAGASSTNCSVTFRRSSLARSFAISAFIQYRVHWEGSGGQNEPLDPPDAPGVTTVQVPVDEVQTVLQNTPTPPAN